MVMVNVGSSAVALQDAPPGESESLFPSADEGMQSQALDSSRPALNIFNDEGAIPEASSAPAEMSDENCGNIVVPPDFPPAGDASGGSEGVAVDGGGPAGEGEAVAGDAVAASAAAAAAAVATPPAGDKAAQEAAAKEAAEQLWQQKLRDAEQEYMDACLLVQECEDTIKSSKEDLKEAKKNCEALATRLRLIRSKQPVQGELALVDADPLRCAPDVHGEIPSALPPDHDVAAGPFPPAVETVVEADDSWRKVAITELDLESIKGFGKKKREAVIDAVPTLGDFEDLRVKGGAMGIADLLPKGCGKAIADALEELEVEWLARWRAGRDQEAVVVGEPAEAWKAADIYPDLDGYDDDEGDIDTDCDDGDDEEAALRHRFTVLSSSSPIEIKSDDAYAAGKACCLDGGAITDCNWTAGDNQDSWLLGFLAGGKAE